MSSRRNLHRSNCEKVWTIVNSISRLTTGQLFGSKEKAEGYMSRNRLNPKSYRPICLTELRG